MGVGGWGGGGDAEEEAQQEQQHADVVVELVGWGGIGSVLDHRRARLQEEHVDLARAVGAHHGRATQQG